MILPTPMYCGMVSLVRAAVGSRRKVMVIPLLLSSSEDNLRIAHLSVQCLWSGAPQEAVEWVKRRSLICLICWSSRGHRESCLGTLVRSANITTFRTFFVIISGSTVQKEYPWNNTEYCLTPKLKTVPIKSVLWKISVWQEWVHLGVV